MELPRPFRKARVQYFVLMVWACFLWRGLYYASFLPVWEGYDEWAHYSFIQYLATHKTLPVPVRDRVSREVDESFQLLPLPWELRGYSKPSLTHDMFWRLPTGERIRRQEQLRALPREWAQQTSSYGPLIYEALQPPLYYWLSSWLLRPIMTSPLVMRVFVLRWWTVNFILIPYYTGLISHRPAGPVSSFHITPLAQTGLLRVFGRLQINKPEFLNATTLMTAWFIYIIATVGVVALVSVASETSDFRRLLKMRTRIRGLTHPIK